MTPPTILQCVQRALELYETYVNDHKRYVDGVLADIEHQQDEVRDSLQLETDRHNELMLSNQEINATNKRLADMQAKIWKALGREE